MADSNFRINKGILLNPQAVAPSNPSNGDVYYDSVQKTFVFYNNGKWFNFASKSDIASATTLTSTQFTPLVVQGTFIRITGSTVSNLYGMTASSDAKPVMIYNQSSQPVTIYHQSVTEGVAVNRIVTNHGNSVILDSGKTAFFVYDDTQSRWILVNTTSYGSSDVQVLTNKDIDGGVASNTRRITLPSDTKTNLDLLTRKEGTIVYGTDTDKVYIDDGTLLKEVGGGAPPVASGLVCTIAEVPAGTGTTRTITYTPSTSVIVTVNGLVKEITTHFSIVGTSIIFTTDPGTDVFCIYGTDSRLVQKNVGTGDGITTRFVTPFSNDVLTFVDGLISKPGYEHTVFGSAVEFITIPAVNQGIYLLTCGLSEINQFTLTGTVDGFNTVFSISAPSVAGAVLICLDGLAVEQGAGAGKCVVSGTTVTFGTPPTVGQVPYGIIFTG